MHWQPLRLLAVALGAGLLAQALPADAQGLPGVLTELTLVEGEAEQLRSVPLRRAQLRSATHVEERLTDGELLVLSKRLASRTFDRVGETTSLSTMKN